MSTKPRTATAKAPEANEEWDEIETSRELLSWEQSQEKNVKPSIEGWVLSEDLVKEETGTPGKPGYMRDFICLRIRLTAACTIVNPNGEKKDLKIDQTLLVPKNAALAELADLTLDSEVVRKVRIVYLDTIPISGGRTLRRFKCQLSRTVGKRAEIAPTTQAKLIAEMKHKALVAGSPTTVPEGQPAAAPAAGA